MSEDRILLEPDPDQQNILHLILNRPEKKNALDGEMIQATIDGIGTLTHVVRAEGSVPADLSGAQLPPVSTYRDNR